MEADLQVVLAANPYILLFFMVGLAVWSASFTSRATAWAWSPRRSSSAAGAVRLGLDLRRQARARQLRQEALLLPVHVWRRPARRSVLHQQPQGGRPEVHRPRRGLLRSSALLVVAGAKLVRPAGGRRGRHARRLADDVGGDRLGRAGGAPGVFALAAGHDRRAGSGDDRALLRHHLHLGHGRHHPDLQVSAALVGHRCQGRGEEVRSRSA